MDRLNLYRSLFTPISRFVKAVPWLLPNWDAVSTATRSAAPSNSSGGKRSSAGKNRFYAIQFHS
eukprot:COSAG06_NODE_887_length_11768_cov_28.624732_12_plen_64_part_00